MNQRLIIGIVVAAIGALAVWPSFAQDIVKIGVLEAMTGTQQSTGVQTLAAMKLYMRQHGDTVAAKKIELIVKDDGAVPENTKRLAQELIVRDRVNFLVGFAITPSALAVAPLATEAKVPMIVTNAGTSIITERSPFITRTGFTQAQSSMTIGNWAAKNGINRAVTIVSDYAPGFDAEKYFTESFTESGGKVLEALRVPLAAPDFAPFLQRARVAHPDAVFIFLPSGQGATFVKQFIERGLDKAGVKLIGPGDVTDDDQLNGMSDQVIGTVTAHLYSADHQSKLNKEFVGAFKKLNNGMRPNFMAVGGYDAMHLIYEALKKTNGDTNGDKLIAVIKGMAWESPRGPISIDPDTREIIQNIYIRKVERKNGELYNVEFETFRDVKDPGKTKNEPATK